MRFQWQSVLFFYEVSVMVGFVQLQNLVTIGFLLLRDSKDSQFYRHKISMTFFFCSFMRFPWHSVLFLYEISGMVGFVRLQNFNDCQFSMTISFLLLLDSTDNQFFHYEISMTVRFQWQPVLFLYEISMKVGFVPLQDFNDSRFCSVTKFQWQSVFSLRDLNDSQFCSFTRLQWQVLFFYKISMTVSFVPLRGFSDSWFCSVTKFQRLSVFNDDRFSYVMIFQRQSVFSLWDLNDGWFCFFTRSQWRFVCSVIKFQWWSVFICYKIPKTVSFFVMWSQWRLVLFLYKISVTAGFVPLQDFNDSRFCFFTRFMWRSVLFLCEVSVMVGFVRLQNFNDYHFSSVSKFHRQSVFPLRDLNDSQFFCFMRFQWRLVLFLYQLSVSFVPSVGFVPLQDLNDGCFCFFTRFHWLLVLFFYKVSVTVGFVRLRNFNDCQFSMTADFLLL